MPLRSRRAPRGAREPSASDRVTGSIHSSARLARPICSASLRRRSGDGIAMVLAEALPVGDELAPGPLRRNCRSCRSTILARRIARPRSISMPVAMPACSPRASRHYVVERRQSGARPRSLPVRRAVDLLVPCYLDARSRSRCTSSPDLRWGAAQAESALHRPLHRDPTLHSSGAGGARPHPRGLRARRHPFTAGPTCCRICDYLRELPPRRELVLIDFQDADRAAPSTWLRSHDRTTAT